MARRAHAERGKEKRRRKRRRRLRSIRAGQQVLGRAQPYKRQPLFASSSLARSTKQPRCKRGRSKSVQLHRSNTDDDTTQEWDEALNSNPKPKCKRCGRAFKRERLAQKYCCARCRNAAVKARLRARSGDNTPGRRRLVLPHREAVTFGQKTPTKTKAIFDPLACNFRRPVIDFLRRGDDLLKLVIRTETRSYPPLYRRPALGGDAYPVEFYADGFPKMPSFLRRREGTQ